MIGLETLGLLALCAGWFAAFGFIYWLAGR